jgi:hypothetical protein
MVFVGVYWVAWQFGAPAMRILPGPDDAMPSRPAPETMHATRAEIPVDSGSFVKFGDTSKATAGVDAFDASNSSTGTYAAPRNEA